MAGKAGKIHTTITQKMQWLSRPLIGCIFKAWDKITDQNLFQITQSSSTKLLFRGFKRVLQLPSEFLQQMSVNLYCHNQNHLPVAMATVGPHKMDCLVGENVLVVHQSIVTADSVHFEQVIII